MKGHVSKRGKTWAYWFDITPDPLTGNVGSKLEADSNRKRRLGGSAGPQSPTTSVATLVTASRHKVAAALDEWLTRIEHSIKPSMVQNWRNYAAYYVIPYIGQRDVQDIDGAVCDALYAKLLVEGRVKARPKKQRRPKRFMYGDSHRMAGSCLAVRMDTTRCAATARTRRTIQL